MERLEEGAIVIRNEVAIPKRVAVLGNSQPRQCGIATFTNDLVGALSAAYPRTDWSIVAMNDRSDGYDYPGIVQLTIDQHDLSSYARAAEALQRADVDLLVVQHEYGIFGGSAGEHLIK